ncbi:MAG: tetratricopeptide repeat protein [Actinomycetota bacterium]
MSDGDDFEKGVSLQKEGSHQEAVEAFSSVIEQDPGNTDAWYRKAICLYEMAAYGESMECVSKVLELKPGDLDAMKLKFALAGKA